ncbi:acetylornithine deacetylase [Paralimibaculum aggregatum]|uniref:Acetylornithine deacetylase n=1 Tax=Paralimibaculum aggregatum TaxID=3036245 RepID=A0ABQ6LHI2_9RHOB|nr:acetylornithine deacetylase [Limibaculum sp. NKW23]GMG82742.1 acetylornithine deacetylase [Limibaculum sp. NKW23]
MPDTYTPQEMLARLVAFPTVSRDSNLALIDFVRDYLAGHGVESRLVHNEEGTKANLYAQIGPAEPGGIILSGHTDVVPVDGQPWSTDPFRLVERDDRLYGRGSCDMKGFDALVLAAVPEMLAAPLKRPVQIALSYDEEVGCLGAPSMIAEMRETLPPASAVVVGEPTEMRVVSRHKGVTGLQTHVLGYEVHSSLCHQGVSAVMTAARLISWAAERMAENKAAAETGSDPVGQLFEPPYTTLHVGRIEGGTAHNITAKDCRFSMDIRSMPGESQEAWIARYRAHCEEIAAEIRAVRPEAGIEVSIRSQAPGCRKEPEETAAAEHLARALTGDNGEHVVAYGTEAGQFQDAGYSAIICGPGSIEQAHQADEFISKAQFAEGARFVSRVIDRLAAA